MADLTRFDRVLLAVAPALALRRIAARLRTSLALRYYDAASTGRRTDGWRRVSGDGNAATQRGLSTRDTARDLVRNNAWARAAVATIVDHTIGWGILPKIPTGAFGQFGTTWKAWAETPACDVAGRRDLHGLARQVLETVVVAGECLVRRQILDDEPFRFRLQVLEPDYLDEFKEESLEGGGQILQGVEFDAKGRRVAYWLLPEHPGAQRVQRLRGTGFRQSVRIPASEILHICLPDRAEQVRGVSWFAPVLLRIKDLDDYLDAALIKQKVAACLAVIITDSSGTGVPLGTADDTLTPGIDSLQPGLIARMAAGDQAQVVQPPSVGEHGPYTKTVLHEIASGLGITYEDLTGDFQQLPFSAARMSRLKHWDRVHCWRWALMIPQFYAGVWAWAVQMGQAMNLRIPATYDPQWTAPPMPMLDPDKEGLGYARNIRAGIQTHSDVWREQGYDRDSFLAEYQEDLKALDARGIILDSDARQTTQAGQLQGKARPPAPAAPAATPEYSADAERADRYEAALVRLAANGNGHHPPPAPIIIPPAEVKFEAGAIRGGDVTVAPADVVVHPAAAPIVNINENAVRAGDVTVAPAEVHTPVNVHAPMVIEPGAIRGGDTTVTPPPASQITVVKTPARRPRTRKTRGPEPDGRE